MGPSPLVGPSKSPCLSQCCWQGPAVAMFHLLQSKKGGTRQFSRLQILREGMATAEWCTEGAIG